jgi:hypothetical protein
MVKSIAVGVGSTAASGVRHMFEREEQGSIRLVIFPLE